MLFAFKNDGEIAPPARRAAPSAPLHGGMRGHAQHTKAEKGQAKPGKTGMCDLWLNRVK